ncbi:MAG TPA: amidase [Terriglobales bacterium]|nr:amidase [Terriglobales bacterium]
MPPAADPAFLSVVAARDAIRAGTLTPTALTDACLARIRALDPQLEAWIHVDEAGARAEAAQRTEEAKAGQWRGSLHGIPVGIKDIFDVAGMPTTAGARPWAHTRPVRDAASVQLLRAKGAVILGKTHTTQFAFRDPAPTRNPWHTEHTPGGSSSGSAAAVAARMAPLALGSQTVGSVLRPAAYCGVVGYKGVHGAVSTEGVVPLAWSLDHVGVFGRSVADVRVVLEAWGVDAEIPPGRTMRLALATELVARAEADVAANIQAVVRALAAAGASIEEVKLPASFAEIHDAGTLILEAEAAAYHEASFAKHGAEYGAGIRALVEAGLTRPAAAYVRADRARRRFGEDAARLIASYDALVTPTAPALPPRGLAWTGDASLCAPWSSTGFPSVSLPAGVAASGLPHALQLVGVPTRANALLHAAAWVEGVLAFTAAPAL